jgi:L-rhamnose mutarotase
MKTYAQALDLKDDPQVIADYRQHHREVWPPVIAGLRRIGITKMKIFLVGNHLFMYFEAPDDFDPARDFMTYAKSEEAQNWEKLMRGFQKPIDAAREGEWWAAMEEVFDIDWF